MTLPSVCNRTRVVWQQQPLVRGDPRAPQETALRLLDFSHFPFCSPPLLTHIDMFQDRTEGSSLEPEESLRQEKNPKTCYLFFFFGMLRVNHDLWRLFCEDTEGSCILVPLEHTKGISSPQTWRCGWAGHWLWWGQGDVPCAGFEEDDAPVPQKGIQRLPAGKAEDILSKPAVGDVFKKNIHK